MSGGGGAVSGGFSGGGSSSSGGFLGGGSSGSSGGGSSSGLGSGGGMSSGTSSSGFLTSTTGFLNSGTTISNLNRSSNTTYNAFSPYFANPLATGWPGSTTGSSTGTFGQPLVGTLTQSSTTSTTMRGGSGTATFSQTTTGIYSMIGQRRSPTYTTAIGFRYRPPTVSQLQPNLQQVIDRSSTLTSSGNTVRVSVDGQTVVLRGSVADDHDRRLAESLVRLTPGVNAVRNELAVRPEAATTASAR
jgi:hypothetical protein